jgi:hypothetical protein
MAALTQQVMQEIPSLVLSSVDLVSHYVTAEDASNSTVAAGSIVIHAFCALDVLGITAMADAAG